MSFFNPDEPVLKPKQGNLDIQDLEGLIRFRWHIKDWTLLSWLYTRIDQVFLLWGWITAVFFIVPQFFPTISWSHHALAASGVTSLGIVLMVKLTWFWGRVESLCWVIYIWATLMLVGMVLTDYGIWGGVGAILLNLCPIWLGLSGLGYLITGIGLRSRTFVITAVVHGAAITTLPLVAKWQFLTTGVVMASCLFILAEVQWDMRPPRLSPLLAPEQQQFNQEQHQKRRLSKS